MPDIDVRRAHRASSFHRAEIEASETCGCFHCLATFAPHVIRTWCDGGATALCPRCGIDSVIGSASGVPIERDFLKAMQRCWFRA